MNEDGGAPNGGGPPNGRVPQDHLEEVHPDNIQVDAYTQLLATVQELQETVGE